MRFIYSKTFIVLSGILAVLALLMFLQNRGWLDPVRAVFLDSPRPVVAITKGTAGTVKDFFSALYGLRQISKQNDELKQKLAHQQRQLADLDLEKRENEALRQELGFAAKAPYGLVPCTVLSQNPVGFSDSLVLNCGSDQGIEVGQAVISGGYLVAKIVYVDSHSSTALLATSSNFTADAELSKTGADGVVSGSFGSGLMFERLPQNLQVEKGWLVITAGLNRKIPKGILVGQIDQVVSSQNDLFKKATLLTPVDFSDLDFVFAVR